MSEKHPHIPELDAVQVRVLGSLIEKQFLTPAQYPLTVNSLRNACNQKSSRDPVVTYHEHLIHGALRRLMELDLAREATALGDRSRKFEHRAERVLGLNRSELAALSVLFLRGPQTPGEIRVRSERLHEFRRTSDVEHVLATLHERSTQPLVVRLPRQTGGKENRYAHTLAGDPPAELPLTDGSIAIADEPAPVLPDGERILSLEEEVANLREELSQIKAILAHRSDAD